MKFILTHTRGIDQAPPHSEIDISTLEELFAIARAYDSSLILHISAENTVPLIEIYDDYRE